MILHEPNPWALLSLRRRQATAAAGDLVPQRRRAAGAAVRSCSTSRWRGPPIARRARFLVSSPALAEHAAALAPYRDRVTRHSVRHRCGRLAADATPTPARGRRSARTAGRPLVLFAGRHVPYKGVRRPDRAAAPLDVRVVIVGDGPMRASWTELAARSWVTARVSFPGEVHDAELRAHSARVRHVRAAVGDAGRSVRLRAARGDGLRQAGDQHRAADRRAVGQPDGDRLVVPPATWRALRAARSTARGRPGARARGWARAARARAQRSSRWRRMRDRLAPVSRTAGRELLGPAGRLDSA